MRAPAGQCRLETPDMAARELGKLGCALLVGAALAFPAGLIVALVWLLRRRCIRKTRSSSLLCSGVRMMSLVSKSMNLVAISQVGFTML